MKVVALCVTPFLFQGAALALDEFHFHRQRGLGLWERWGHPLDTFSVLIPVAWALQSPWSSRALLGFLALAIASCLFVTKDEWIHRKQAGATEQWLHALMFMLHPLVFVAVGWLWRTGGTAARAALFGQAALLLVFLVYQGVWWGILGRGRWPS